MKRIIASQFRKPAGILGKLVGIIMKKSNNAVYHKIIEGLKLTNDDSILEIGYGTGNAINLIGKKSSNCSLTGIDFSPLMHKKAVKLNAELIHEDRLKLLLNDFIMYDFQQNEFTKIFCINVIYFWSDLELYFKKIYLLLKDHGVFSIYMVSPDDLLKLKFTKTDVFNAYSYDYVQDSLKKAGFSKVEKSVIQSTGKKAYIVYATK